MSKFIEISAEGMDAVRGVITLRDEPGARYLIAVDVTGCDKEQETNRLRRAGEALARFIGGRRVLVMPERNGIPYARVFALEADPE